jgi:hypothetical protein
MVPAVSFLGIYLVGRLNMEDNKDLPMDTCSTELGCIKAQFGNQDATVNLCMLMKTIDIINRS